jgi:hypothetical protein
MMPSGALSRSAILLARRLQLAFNMGGPNLEIFKFSIYLFVPIAALVHFGDPEWYRTTVVPVRTQFYNPKFLSSRT